MNDQQFNPFPGLRPFEPDEDHLFFGRERETDELLRRLRTNRFVSVLGTSGSGKSSLVRSGLIPSLHSGFMVQAGSAWRVAIFRPGEDPIGNLAAALNQPGVLGDDVEIADVNRMLLETTLRRSALGLCDCVKHARLPEHENLVVVVDQFEELFRFRESRKAHGSRDEAIAFAKLLLGAANQTEVPVYIVVTMRSDFIGDCMEYPGLPEAINQGQYLIPRMTRDELRHAITGPVAVGGGAISPRLVARLLNEVGDDPDGLPVLQHAMMRSWDAWRSTDDEMLDLEHYESIGTMTDGLSRHAEQAFDELHSDGDREIAERLFKQLTDRRGDERGVRRPTSVCEVADSAGITEQDVIRVVEVFRRPGRSFLMPPASVALSGDSILDLSHESLMRNWARLVEWVEEETISGKSYRRLCRAATRYERGEGSLWVDPELAIGLQWRETNKPTAVWARRYDPNFEQAMRFLDQSHRAQEAARAAEEAERRAKLRRARIVSAVLGTAAVVTLVFGLLALRAGHIARQAEQVAQEEAQTSSAVTDFLVGLFEVVDPESGRGSSISAREILDQGADRIDSELEGQPEVQARMKRTVGKVYGSLGLYEEAESLLVSGLQTLEEQRGPDDPEVFETQFRLAQVLEEQGRYREAQELYEKSLDGRRRAFGDEAPETLESMAGMASVHLSQGRFQDGLEVAQLAYAGQRRVLGEEHKDTLQSLFRVGEAQSELGRFAAAESTLTRTWEAQKKTLGDEHPQTMATMGELGKLYTDLGRFDEAQELYEDNLESRRRVFGEEHPKTLTALQRMARLNETRGRWNEAQIQMEQVLEVRRRVLGEEHPSTLDSERQLAWLYRDLSKLNEAEALARHSFDTAVRTLGEENKKTRDNANVLAAVLSNQGLHASAEKLYTANLEIYTRLYGPAHPSTASARNNLGVCYGNWGRIEKNYELFRENYDIYREAYGEENPQTLFYRNNLIAVLLDQRLYDQAESLAVEGLELHRKVLGSDNPQTLQAMLHLFNTYGRLNRDEEREALMVEWVDRHRELFGEEHPETLDAMSRLANFYQNNNRLPRARELREQVLEGRRRIFGEDHASTISAEDNLAWLCDLEGKPEEALELRRQAMEARRRMAEAPTAGPHEKRRYASALVYARRELQNPEVALEFAKQACEMTDFSDRNYVQVLAEAYLRVGRIDEAIAMQEKAISLVSDEDPRPRDWLERRLAEFHEANGNPGPKREMQAREIARKKEAAEVEGASPRARDSYAWELLTASSMDLRDPAEALRVAESVNEETHYEQTGLLGTLALAYHMTGDDEKAVEIGQKILDVLPEDDVWGQTQARARMRVYRGEGSDDADLSPALKGRWSGKIGPIPFEIEFQRDGDQILGVNQKEIPWVPAGEVWLRYGIDSHELTIARSDAGWTNVRYEPCEYRLIGNDQLLVWHYQQWFVAQMTQNQEP